MQPEGFGVRIELSTGGGQSSLLERHASRCVILSEFCAVHVLLESKNLSTSWNSGVSTFQRLATAGFQSIVRNNE